MIEFEISGKQYRADKMNVFQQLHVSRKIAPLIPALIPIFLAVSQMKGGIKDNLSVIATVLQPFADGIATLPDDATEYVIGTCMSAVRRQQGEHWAPVWSEKAKAMMFDDIDLTVMMQIVVQVIQDNLGPFISGLLTSQQTAVTPPAA